MTALPQANVGRGKLEQGTNKVYKEAVLGQRFGRTGGNWT
jgi:hypothetical protein